jgi:S-adenosylhomocysteine hydrolase
LALDLQAIFGVQRDYKVKDMSQVDFRRLEIELAKVEMLRLMTCWVEFDPTLPLKGT